MRGFLVFIGFMVIIFVGGGGYLMAVSILPATTITGEVTARGQANPNSPKNRRCKFTVNGETFTTAIQLCDEMSNRVTATVRGGEADSMSDDRGHTWSAPAARYVYIGLGAFMMLGGLVIAGAFYRTWRRRPRSA